MKNFKKNRLQNEYKEEFLKAISDDPFGLTIVKKKVSANKDESKIVIEKFMKILEFYERNKKRTIKRGFTGRTNISHNLRINKK